MVIADGRVKKLSFLLPSTFAGFGNNPVVLGGFLLLI
jgi:hypothetical protein